MRRGAAFGTSDTPDMSTPYRDSDRLARLEGRVDALEQEIGSKARPAPQRARSWLVDHTRTIWPASAALYYQMSVLFFVAALAVGGASFRAIAVTALAAEATLALVRSICKSFGA